MCRQNGALAAGAALTVFAAAPPLWLLGSNAVRHVVHVSMDGLRGFYLRDALVAALAGGT
jgi:hypothetical protein